MLYKDCGLNALCVALAVLYAFILFKASKLIADGSEMLMLVLDPGLIGGLVLPIMGGQSWRLRCLFDRWRKHSSAL